MKGWDNKMIDVLIVGAGPTGLMMACQLAIHKISFRIIDKNELPSASSGALIVQARSLEIFEQMGIADEAIKEGIVAHKINVVYEREKITSTVIKDIGENLSQFPFLLMLEQTKTEQLLLKFIEDYSCVVERGITFKSFVQDKEQVTSMVILPDGTEQHIKSQYIIAADGANSAIRNFLQVPFTGKTYPNPIFILDCKAKTGLEPDEISIAFSNFSVTGFFPLQGSRWRIDSNLPKTMEGNAKITLDDIRADFQLRTKMNVTFEDIEWFSATHSHQKYATAIRIQNCFLAGDSAHVNTPVGAQGMNVGLQDAYNLAWKLAFVIKQTAKPELLDSYSSERIGISKGFARYADAVYKLITSKNVVINAFRLYVLKVLFKILLPLVEKSTLFRQMFFKSISQISIQYGASVLSYHAHEGFFLNSAPKPGDRLPYLEFFYMGNYTNTHKLLNTACFNLIVLVDVLPDEMKQIAETYHITVKSISYLPETIELYKSWGIRNTGFYLVRPDMHIALRSATLHPQHLNNYLKQLMGIA